MNKKVIQQSPDIEDCDQNSSEITPINTLQAKPINRRRFLALTTLGMGGLGLLSHSNNALAQVMSQPGAENASTVKMSSTTVSSHCKQPSIATRIFSSSNTSSNEIRNELGLQRLTCAGFDIQNPEVTRRQYLRFGGTDLQRASDLQNIATGAIDAPKVLIAARGGYGAMRLLELVDWESLGRIMQERQSILVGFSDVTALQCALLAKGNMSSLAGPMLYSEFGKQQPDVVSCQGFVEAITNPNLELNLTQQSAASSLSKPITGTIWGGNLSVVSALAGTPYLPQLKGGIVFLEDVGEQPYQVERMLYNLYLSGAFRMQRAIILGAFNRTGEDSYDARYDMSLVIKQLQRITGLPVLTGMPFGHVANKQSFPLGTMCHITPTASGITLQFEGYPTIDRELIYAEGLWS